MPGGRAPANLKNVRVPWDIVQFRPFFLIRSLLLTGAERPAVGFRAQAIGFSDSRAGMQGRCVWTDERSDMVYSELKALAALRGGLHDVLAMYLILALVYLLAPR